MDYKLKLIRKDVERHSILIKGINIAIYTKQTCIKIYCPQFLI